MDEQPQPAAASGNWADYDSKLSELTNSPGFAELDDRGKGLALAGLRDGYSKGKELSLEDQRIIGELTTARSKATKSARVQIDPVDFAKSGLTYPDVNLPGDQALANVAKFRKDIAEKAVDFDPVFREDYEFSLNNLADAEERKIRGRGIDRPLDLNNRAIKGYVGGMLRNVGLSDAADSMDKTYWFLPTKPEYDEDFVSKLATGAGDFIPTMGLILGASALGGPVAGGAVGLSSNSARKYQEAYKSATELGYDATSAHDAGLAAMPGAAFETIGDQLLAGKLSKSFLPDRLRDSFFKASTSSARAEVIKQALKDSDLRSRLAQAAVYGFATEGISESGGDFISGIGAAAVTGEEKLKATPASLRDSFLIGGILGSGAATAFEAATPVAAPIDTKEKQLKIKSLLDAGDMDGVAQLMSEQAEQKPETKQPELPEPKPLLEPSIDKVDSTTGAVTKTVKGLQGKEFTVSDEIATIHDSLIERLSVADEIDELNELPAGKRKGEKNNPAINKERSVKQGSASMMEESLSELLPERSRLFDELDRTAGEVKLEAEQVSLAKRTVDAVALTAIQNGLDPRPIYANLAFRSDKPANQEPAAPTKGKTRTAAESFAAEADYEAEKRKLGLAQEIEELRATQDEATLEQAKFSDAREHFDPKLFDQFKESNLGWKEVLVDMPIDDFLAMAYPIADSTPFISIKGEKVTSKENADALAELLNQDTKLDELPFLSIDEYDRSGKPKIAGHEGRHRAKALKALGYETMPVVVRSSKIRWSEQGENGREFYRIKDEDWPSELTNENGTETFAFPLNRNGTYKGIVQPNIELDEQSNQDSDLLYQDETQPNIKSLQKAWRDLKPVQNAPKFPFLQNGTAAGTVQHVAKVFEKLPEAVTAADGSTVILKHGREGGSEQGLYEHLATKADGRPDVLRAAYTARIPATLEQASLKATDPTTKNSIYVARYQDKGKNGTIDSVHYVVVKPDGQLVDQGYLKTAFVNEFAAGPDNKRADFPTAKLYQQDAALTPTEGWQLTDSTSNISEQSPIESGYTVWVNPSTELEQSQAELLTNALFSKQGKGKEIKGRISFVNQQGKPKSTAVELKQLNNELKGVITLMRNTADVSTVHHELIHYFHGTGLLSQLLTPNELAAFERAAGVKPDAKGKLIWKRENYESVAKSYEAWLRNPLRQGSKQINVPKILQSVFRKISHAMSNLYKSLRDSGLPYKVNKSGAAQPNINPDFARAFEKLYGFDQTLRLRGDQSAPQLASVNRQLTGRGGAVSGQQTNPSLTEGQLDQDVYEPDEDDQRNIKLAKGYKPKTSLEQKIDALVREILDLSTGLHKDDSLSGYFYAVLDNFARSRRLSRNEEVAPELRKDPNAFLGKGYTPIKGADENSITKETLLALQPVRDRAFKLWFEGYQQKNQETLADAKAEDFGSKLEVIKYNNEQKLTKAAKEDDDKELSARRQAINDNISLAQAALRLRSSDSLPNVDPSFGPLHRTTLRYYEFLKLVDGSSAELNDLDAFQLQFVLDTILNDDTVIGLSNYAKYEAALAIGQTTGLEKFRNPFSKFGLIGILESITGKRLGEIPAGLRLTSINIEALASNQAAKDFLNRAFMDEYYTAVTEAQTLKNAFKQFMAATRTKHYGKNGPRAEQVHLSGIISKVIQTPIDLSTEAEVDAIANNVAQLLQGFTNEAKRTQAGQLKIELLNKLLADLPANFTQDQFLQHAQEKFPAETGFMLDMVQWLQDNITPASRFVTEGLYEKPFNPQGYYLPTQQLNLNPPEADKIDIEGSFLGNQYGGDEFNVPNPITVSRTGSLQERTGYLADANFNTYNTNLEAVLDSAVDGIINDIYTGFTRRKIGFLLNPSKGGLYGQVENILGGKGDEGHVRRAHLRKTMHDMISTDLAQHKYITELERLTSRFRQAIAPAMLSSIHQAVTQPMSQFVAHVFRNPGALPHYLDAFNMMFNPSDSLKVMLDRHLSTRAPAPDYLLAKGASVPAVTPLDKLGNLAADYLTGDKDSFTQWRNKAKLLNEKTRDALLFGLRTGDMLSAKVIFTAELIKAGKATQRVVDPAKIDYTAIPDAAVVDAVNIMDEAVNASRNSRRGTILAHPNTLLSLVSIFAGHRISVASATGLRIRNLTELAADGNFKDGMFADSAKYVAATMAQSVTFTALKYGLLAAVVRALYEALTPEEDAERHWLYGELEEEEVKALRKNMTDKLQTSFGPDTLKTNVIRDLTGNIILISAFGGVDNVIFGYMDPHAKASFEAGQKETVEQLTKQLNVKLNEGVLDETAITDLQKQIEAVESTKFVPFSFKNFGTDDLSGGVGAAAQPVWDFATAINESVVGSKSLSAADFALFLRVFGLGQPEVTKALKLLNANQKVLSELEEPEQPKGLPEFEF